MSAYLMTLITGNESFGGYLSVDGEKAFSIEHDMTYELAPGAHTLIIYSTSNFQRSAGKVQAYSYINTRSSGAIVDSIERNAAIKNLGDSWEIDVMVEEGDLLELNITSRGSEIVATPQYRITELDEEAIKHFEETFEKWRNTPIRSPKQIVWGAILAFLGVFGTINFINSPDLADNAIAVILVMVALVGVGVLLIILGAKKKIRRK